VHILRSSRQGYSWKHCDEWYQKGALACRSEDDCPNTKSLEDIGNSSYPYLDCLHIYSSICHDCFPERGGSTTYGVTLRALITDRSLLPSRFHNPYGKAIKAERITDPEILKGIAKARLRGDACYVDYKTIFGPIIRIRPLEYGPSSFTMKAG